MINPDQYAEDPQDGCSHLRSQMLWEYYSLLNHDLAGFDESSRTAREFVKERSYAELSEPEVHELDQLASLLARDPRVEELAAFYQRSATLRPASVEQDPYAFILRQ